MWLSEALLSRVWVLWIGLRSSLHSNPKCKHKFPELTFFWRLLQTSVHSQGSALSLSNQETLKPIPSKCIWTKMVLSELSQRRLWSGGYINCINTLGTSRITFGYVLMELSVHWWLLLSPPPIWMDLILLTLSSE